MQKTVQNDKKFCLSGFISQEPYIIWSSFMVHMCKMIISPGFFFQFFKIVIFWVVWRVERQKIVQNDKKILSVMLYISGTIHNMVVIYGTHDNISRLFFQFFKILIFWVVRGVKEQKVVQKMTKNFACFAPYLRYHPFYDCHLWCKIFWVFRGLKGQKKAQN